MDFSHGITSEPAAVLALRGRDRLALLQRLSSADLRPLATPGRAAWTLFLTAQGRLVDWTQVFATDDALIVVASAGREAALAAWIDRYVIMDDVTVTPCGGDYVLFTAGAAAAAALRGRGPPPADTWDGEAGTMWAGDVAAYGGRLRGLVPLAAAPALAAAAAGLPTLGPEARTAARLAAGVPAPTAEYAEACAPLELGLGAVAVGWNKGCYIGQEVIARLTTYDRVARRLVGVRADAPLAAVPGARLRRGGQIVGRLTSVGPGLTPGHGAGLALVRRPDAVPGPAELDTAPPQAVTLWLPPFCASFSAATGAAC